MENLKNAINKEIKELLLKAEKNLKEMELWSNENFKHSHKVDHLIATTKEIIMECKKYLEPEVFKTTNELASNFMIKDYEKRLKEIELPNGIEEKEQLTKEQKENLI